MTALLRLSSTFARSAASAALRATSTVLHAAAASADFDEELAALAEAMHAQRFGMDDKPCTPPRGADSMLLTAPLVDARRDGCGNRADGALEGGADYFWAHHMGPGNDSSGFATIGCQN